VKFSILEHGAEDAIEIAIDVRGVGYRQLVTGGILFLYGNKLLKENWSRCVVLLNLELENRG
jgi:hypothetical protein